MLRHQDASRHTWLAGEPACDLLVTLDDATGEIYSAQLVAEEGTASSFRGLGSKAPIAALALTVFLFSLTGIPPFAGFAGKYLIFAAVVREGRFWYVLLAVIGVLNSAVSLFYYARIIKAMYLDDALDDRPLAVPAIYTGVLVALAVPILVLGLYWAPLVRWASTAFGGGNIL